MVDYSPMANKRYDVIVVDDDTVWGSEFATKTEGEGLVVLCLADPLIAQSYLESCPSEYAPDVGIIDMQFKGYESNSHLAIAYLLETLNPDAKTIFVTGHWSPHDQGSMDSPVARNAIAYTKVDKVESTGRLKICMFMERFAKDRKITLEDFLSEFPPTHLDP